MITRTPLLRPFVAALIALVPTALSAQAAGGEIVSGPLGQRADSLMRALAGKGFSGVVLVASNGQVVLEKGYGMANRAAGIPMRPSTVVQIGSNTKDFTTVAILQLMERGALALDDPITKYFPSVPADKQAITIRELLDHRAGFDQHLGPDFAPVTREQEIERALASRLVFPPGTDRKYSNIGYSLLAAIIEHVSGESYDTYVRDHILAPLGLHDTGLVLPHFDHARLAHGYRAGEDMGTFLDRPLAPDGPYWNLRGNGGMLSTVSDMHRFYQALFSDGPLLRPASRDLYFPPDRPMVLAGSDMTCFFFYSRHPRAGLDVFLASNSTDYPAPQARDALDAVLGVGVPHGAPPGAQIAIDTGPSKRERRIGGSARDAAGLDAPVAWPASPAAAAARSFLEASATATDSAAVRRFLEESTVPRASETRSLAQRIAGFQQMSRDLGFLTPTRITSASPYEISFDARSVNQGPVGFTIAVEPQAPHRITGIRVETQ